MANIERGGIASFYANGALYEVSADISLKLGGLSRKAVISSNGVAGYVTEWMAPEVTIEAIDGPGVSVTTLKAINGATVQIQFNNGKTYNVISAFQIDDPDIKVNEGKVSGLKFSGQRAQEIPA